MNQLSKRALRLIDNLSQDLAKSYWTGAVLPEHVVLALLQSQDGLGFELLKRQIGRASCRERV